MSASLVYTETNSKYSLEKNTEISILGGSTFVLLSGYLLDKEKKGNTEKEINNLSRNDINWFDRSATNNWSPISNDLSDIFYGIGVSTPFLFSCIFPRIREDFIDINLMYIETFLVCQSLIFISKSAIDRKRPYLYNKNAPINEKLSKESNRSFFSGHTATTFAAMVFTASIYSHYYNDSSKYIIWIATLSIGSTVGILRYVSGQHFPSDIIVGTLIGGSIGYIIPELHKNNSVIYSKSSKNGTSLMIAQSIPF
jgi:membrane-associated phospholipid phosphatase